MRLQDHRPTPDEVLERDLLRRDVHTMLGQLPDKYSRVLRLRYGEQPMTGRALAEQMGVTSARVFQVGLVAVSVSTCECSSS